MAYVINLINNILMISIVLISILVFGCLYLMKVLIPSGKVKFSFGSKGIDVDYRNIRMLDSVDFLQFDDIICPLSEGIAYKNSSVARDAVIVTDNGTRYIAGIVAEGHNYFNESGSEQVQCIEASANMISLVSEEVSYRQSTKKVAVEETIERYKKIIEELQVDLARLALDREELVAKLKSGVNETQEYVEAYAERIDYVEKQMDILQWKIREIERIQAYENINANYGAREKKQCYFVSWKYDPTKYNNRVMDEEAIKKEAFKELKMLCDKYIDALISTGARAGRLSFNECMDLFRQQMQPLSSEKTTIEDVLDNVDQLVVTSDSLEEVKSLLEEEKEMDEIEKILKEMGAAV